MPYRHQLNLLGTQSTSCGAIFEAVRDPGRLNWPSESPRNTPDSRLLSLEDPDIPEHDEAMHVVELQPDRAFRWPLRIARVL